VQERAAGVPLYAVELIRMLVSEGTLVGEGDSYRLAGELDSMAIPESLHAVIGARLDRLDPEERDLLQNAAVLGQTFFVDGLAALSGLSAESIEPLLSALVRQELLEIRREPRSPEQGQYAFVQALIREVAYGRISRQDRRQRHLEAARYYGDSGDDEVAAIVASHYLAAYEASPPGAEADELAQLAVDALVDAAERAASLHSHDQALFLCRQALEMLPEAADQTRILELAVVSAAASAQAELVDEYGPRLLDWQRGRGDKSGYARAVWLYGRALLDVQAPDRAIKVLGEVVTSQVDVGSDPALVSAAVELARAYLLSGKLAEAAATAERALVSAERLEMIPEITHALITRGASLGSLGRLREGLALLQGALELAIEHDLPQAELRARANLGSVAYRDRYQMVAEVVPPALEKSRRIGDRSFELFFAWWLVVWSTDIAEFDQVLAMIEEYGETGIASYDLSWDAVGALIGLHRDSSDADIGEIEAIAGQAAGLDNIQARSTIEIWQARAYRAVGMLDEAYQLARASSETAPAGYAQAAARGAAARAAGYRAGESIRFGTVPPGADVFTIPRVNVPAGIRPSALDCWSVGIRPAPGVR
jgi:tetratricopeptide (TPR) repeat protein